jgi:hypothetical protein
MNPYDFSPFEMLKGILKDRECKSNEETRDAIANVDDQLIVDSVQRVFQNQPSRLT